jgi:hypothetical protein
MGDAYDVVLKFYRTREITFRERGMPARTAMINMAQRSARAPTAATAAVADDVALRFARWSHRYRAIRYER